MLGLIGTCSALGVSARLAQPARRPAPHTQRYNAPTGLSVTCSATRESSSDEQRPLEQVEEGWLWQLGTKSKAAVAELRRDRVKAKKSLGQNFLTDDKILADIVFSAGIRPGDLVLEVGPGTGNLTRHLVATGAQVTAVEKDDYLVTKLEKEFAQAANFKLVHGDITRLNMNELLEGMLQQGRPSSSDTSSAGEPSTSAAARAPAPAARLKVVANLPYNITKDFLTIMLPRADVISELSIMIQEEVARRLVNRKPGVKDWRAMSITTHFYSRPKYRFRIPRAKYYPVPGVDGALVTFMLRPPAQRASVPDDEKFLKLVKKAFNQRRKKLRNSLEGMHAPGKVEAALKGQGLSLETRAQDLTVEQFAGLAWELHNLGASWVDEGAAEGDGEGQVDGGDEDAEEGEEEEEEEGEEDGVDVVDGKAQSTGKQQGESLGERRAEGRQGGKAAKRGDKRQKSTVAR